MQPTPPFYHSIFPYLACLRCCRLPTTCSSPPLPTLNSACIVRQVGTVDTHTIPSTHTSPYTTCPHITLLHTWIPYTPHHGQDDTRMDACPYLYLPHTLHTFWNSLGCAPPPAHCFTFFLPSFSCLLAPACLLLCTDCGGSLLGQVYMVLRLPS